MTRSRNRSRVLGFLLPTLAGGIYSCGSSTDGTEATGGKPGGSVCASSAECTSGLCLSGTCASTGGGACTAGADCASGVCQSGLCVGNGLGAPSGSPCTASAECASGFCSNGFCGAGNQLPDGSSCVAATECASGACTGGICGSGTSGGNPDGSTGTGTGGGANNGSGGAAAGAPCSVDTDCPSSYCVNGACLIVVTGGGGAGTTQTPGAQWSGSGTGYRSMTAGCGPSTATDCTGACEQSGGDPNVTVIRPPATLCFSSPDDLTPADPAVVIEQSIEMLNGVSYVHLRVTFDPSFVDNLYGTDSNRSDSGWGQKGGIHIYNHTFAPDLLKSDHAELLLTNSTGTTVMDMKYDYVSADPTQPCGYGDLGVTGGDGLVISGDPTKVLATTTSIERNLNGCGYCTSGACAPSGDCTIDSPTTDANYTPNPLTPNWDYRVVYEAWIDTSAFGTAGFGQAYMTYVHASPNKSTLVSYTVTPSECPPTWNTPYCPPSVIAEGGNCFGSPSGSGGTPGDGGVSTGGTGGTGGTSATGGTTSAGGTPGTGGSPGTCPVNYQIYITTEGQSLCTPIPFANYPGMTACPAGYYLDLASEGRYCLPL